MWFWISTVSRDAILIRPYSCYCRMITVFVQTYVIIPAIIPKSFKRTRCRLCEWPSAAGHSNLPLYPIVSLPFFVSVIMPIDIVTTVIANVAGQTVINHSASFSAGAIDTISLELAASVVDQEVLIQPGPATAIQVLALYCDPSEPLVAYKIEPIAPAINLNGAHVYNGPSMVALLGVTPTRLYFSNPSASARPLNIVIGRNP